MASAAGLCGDACAHRAKARFAAVPEGGALTAGWPGWGIGGGSGDLLLLRQRAVQGKSVGGGGVRAGVEGDSPEWHLLKGHTRRFSAQNSVKDVNIRTSRPSLAERRHFHR